jgi:hypothetical protein
VVTTRNTFAAMAAAGEITTQRACHSLTTPSTASSPPKFSNTFRPILRLLLNSSAS